MNYLNENRANCKSSSQTQNYKVLILPSPYKVSALETCDVVDPRAERIGCVNTMVRKDGKWHGYNTDYDGLVFTLEHAGIDVSGKECIILGDGAPLLRFT